MFHGESRVAYSVEDLNNKHSILWQIEKTFSVQPSERYIQSKQSARDPNRPLLSKPSDDDGDIRVYSFALNALV